MIAGVAGGLATHLRLDPALVRVLLAVLALTGVGVLLYLIGWLLIPEEDTQSSSAEVALRRARMLGDAALERAPGFGKAALERARGLPSRAPMVLVVIAIVLLGIGGLALLTQIVAPYGPTLWALVLIAVGVWLYRRDGRRFRAPAGPPEQAVTRAEPVTQSTSLPTLPGAPPTLVRHRRPRSPLSRYTIAAMLVVVGLVAMLDSVGAITVVPRHYPALALLVIGGGLVLGTFWGRSPLLMALGLLVTPSVLAASLVRVPLEGGAGERVYAPRAVQEIRGGYRLIAGPMQVDLTRMHWGTEPVEITASVGFGEIEVLVPQFVTVEFRGHTGAGEIKFFDEERSGIEVNLRSFSESGEGGPRLVLDAETSFGPIYVGRAFLAGGDKD